MHVLLLRPPAEKWSRAGLRLPPLGLASLAGSLIHAGIPTTLLDALGEGLSLAETEARVARARPTLLGVTLYTPTLASTLHALRRLRPRVDQVVVGGPHVARDGESLLHTEPAVDYVIPGEGELPLVGLAKALRETRRPPPMPGVISREGTGEPALLPDPDSLPFPARWLLPNRVYRYPLATGRPLATLVTARGCPYACTFCDPGVSGRRLRARSAESVLDELRQLRAMGFAWLGLYDDCFTLDRARAEAICRGLVAEGSRMPWKCEARVDQVDRALLRLMRQAGCRLVAFGLETAHEAGLARLGKGFGVAQAERAFRAAHAEGLETLAYCLAGIPGEGPAEVARTVDFCRRLKVSWLQLSTLSALPGTALHAQAMAEGWLEGGEVRGPLDADVRRATVLAPGWTASSLKQAVWSGHIQFYGRPTRLPGVMLGVWRGWM